MKAVDFAEALERLDEILDEARSQPIVITRQGQDTAVIVSIAEYDRLRLASIQSFLKLRKELASDAARAGLTEERLAELLDDREP